MRSLHRQSAFSLIELLVVIGILTLLIGILVPTVTRSMKKGREAKAAADLQTISVALEAYRGDFGDYPRPLFVNGMADAADRPNPVPGAQLLCRALVGPLPETEDGADGPGFRIRGTQGKVWGPYFQLGAIALSSPLDGSTTLIDGNGIPILYVVKSRTTSLPEEKYIENHPPGSSTLPPLYNFYDARVGGGTTRSLFHRTPTDTKALARFASMMGDRDNDGKITGTEQAATTAPYLLWMAGEDEEFGPEITGTTPTDEELAACDDITNFKQP